MAFIAGPVPTEFERLLTATAAGYERDLRQAWPATERSADTLQFVVSDGAATLHIAVAPAGVRRLGLFELPQLVARYRFTQGDEPARRGLLLRLDRAMQKGGG